MTLSRIVVSWLVFFFLMYRGGELAWEWGEDLRRAFQAGEPSTPFRDWFRPPVTAGKALLASPLWAAVAAAVMAPWIGKFLRFMGVIPPLRDEDPSRAERWNLIGRWSFCLLVVIGMLGWLPSVVGWFLLSDTGSGGGGNVWIFLLLLVPAAVAPEIAQIASSGMTAFIDEVFFPSRHESRPPFTLKLARFYVEKRRWEDAEAELVRVLSWHPEELEAWRERLALAFRRAEESAEAEPSPETVLAEALRQLRRPEDKEAIHAQFIRTEARSAGTG